MIKTLAKVFFPDRITIEPIEGPFFPPEKFDLAWVFETEGLFHLDFPKVQKSAANIVSAGERSRFLTEVVLEWVYQLSLQLESNYRMVRTKHFVVLAPAGYENGLAEFCQKTRITTKNLLSKIVLDDLEYPVAIIAFDSTEPYYYSYQYAYLPEDATETAASGGTFYGSPANHHICLQHPFGHDKATYERTIAHELSHCLLTHLNLPMWLDEGITQIVEEAVAGGQYVETLEVRALTKRNREYWSAATIQKLWTGESFYIEESQELSYYFSKALVHLIRSELCNSPDDFTKFVTTANKADAGEAAFKAIFGESLGVLVEEALGNSKINWSPKPAEWGNWKESNDPRKDNFNSPAPNVSFLAAH